EPGEKRRCELAALGHGVDGPRADGLDQDRVRDALVAGGEDEGPLPRDPVDPADVEPSDQGPGRAYEALCGTVESHRATIRGWNSMISPFPVWRKRRRSARQTISSQKRVDPSGKVKETTPSPLALIWRVLELGCTAVIESRVQPRASPRSGRKVMRIASSRSRPSM